MAKRKVAEGKEERWGGMRKNEQKPVN